MTNVQPSQNFASADHDHDGWIVVWAMPTASIGLPGTNLIGFADHTIQIEGVWGVGASVQIVGSNDGVNYHVLNDSFGNPLSGFTGPTIKQVHEAAAFVVPQVLGGDGTTAITVTALFRKTKP